MEQMKEIVNQFERPVSEIASDGVMKRVVTELQKLNQEEDSSLSWFSKAMDLFTFFNSIETGFGHAKACVLYSIKERWDDLDFEIRKAHGLSFMSFARTTTGKESSTIDNWMRVVKVWLSPEGVRPAFEIPIKERLPGGQPKLDDHGKQIIRYEEFDPFKVDMTKLLLVNSKASNGEMTDRLWEMVADPFYSCDDIRYENLSLANGDDSPILKFFLVGPDIYASRDGDSVPVVTADEGINWDAYYQEDGLEKEAIQELLSRLQIKMDEDVIFEQSRHAY